MTSDYPRDRLEIIVVDGMSDDGTRTITAAYAERHPWIAVRDNPARITPVALNLGIAQARGAIVMRMDAHCWYPPNYISGLVSWLDKSAADNVGGVCITLPGAKTPVARAIAVGLSHPFGVGNAYFRIGSAQARWVDTVPFGCYRREVFERIGLFDEELPRNQDDEFNHRLVSRGGRVLLAPGIVSWYYARESLRQLWRMFYQYGYFKPLVLRKVGRILTLRQVVPSLFILALIGFATLAPWSTALGTLGAMLAAAYAVTTVGSALPTVFKHGTACGIALCFVFPVMHMSYGMGFLRGVLHFLVLRGTAGPQIHATPLSR